MALGDYLASLNLAPEHIASLTDRYGAPTPDEMAKYGATPAEQGAAQRFNAAPSVAATSPTANPAWTPAAEAAKGAEMAQQKKLDAATPQGPAGSDGFPTYRDLSASGEQQPAPHAPAAPMQVVPAHWSHDSRDEKTQRTEFDPGRMQSSDYYRDAAAGQRMIAGEKHLHAAQMQAEADVAYSAAHERASKSAQEHLARLQAEKESYVASEQAKLNELNVRASQKVDPELAKGSIGQQIFSAIAIGLGQFGASMTGGTNAALQIVNANIDRNIASQRDNVANAGKARDQEQSLFRQNLEAFGDRERAVLATKMQYLDQAKAMADQQYATSKGTANEGKYAELIAGIDDEKAKHAEDWAKLTSTQKIEQSTDKYRQASVVGGGVSGGAAGAKGKEAMYVPTLGGYARDAETARKLNGHAAMRTQINEDLHEIHSLLDEAKGKSSISDYGRMQEIRQRIDALKHGVLQKTTVLAEQGAMSKGDQSVAEARSGLESVDPQLKTEAQIERMKKALSSVAKGHQRDARFEAEANGIQIGREEYQQGPSGPTPVSRLAGQTKVVTKKAEDASDLIERPKGVTSR